MVKITTKIFFSEYISTVICKKRISPLFSEFVFYIVQLYEYISGPICSKKIKSQKSSVIKKIYFKVEMIRKKTIRQLRVFFFAFLQ